MYFLKYGIVCMYGMRSVGPFLLLPVWYLCDTEWYGIYVIQYVMDFINYGMYLIQYNICVLNYGT